MKWINFERIMMVLGALSASFAIYAKFAEGYSSYGWPLGALLWILVAFAKDLEIKSLTKNK